MVAGSADRSNRLWESRLGHLLAICAVGTTALVTISMLTSGHAAMWTIALQHRGSLSLHKKRREHKHGSDPSTAGEKAGGQTVGVERTQVSLQDGFQVASAATFCGRPQARSAHGRRGS